MPAHNVDLTAVLPVLKDALMPFEKLITAADRLPPAQRMNDNTPLRNALGGPVPSFGDLRKLVEAVNAVRRMAGEL